MSEQLDGSGNESVQQVAIRIPTPLRGLTGGQGEVAVQAVTVGQALVVLERQFEGLAGRILDPDGEVRGFINVYVGETDIRRLDGLRTPLVSGATLSVLPAVAGGGA